MHKTPPPRRQRLLPVPRQIPTAHRRRRQYDRPRLPPAQLRHSARQAARSFPLSLAVRARGALYHHFGDKKGLLAAVVEQIDSEMDARLQAISDKAESAWEGFHGRCEAYLQMALEPEIQRLVLRDARAVLGDTSPEAQRHCVKSMQHLIDSLIAQGVVAEMDSEALALLIYGSLSEASFWIADGDQSSERFRSATDALKLLLRGLLVST